MLRGSCVALKVIRTSARCKFVRQLHWLRHRKWYDYWKVISGAASFACGTESGTDYWKAETFGTASLGSDTEKWSALKVVRTAGRCLFHGAAAGWRDDA